MTWRKTLVLISIFSLILLGGNLSLAQEDIGDEVVTGSDVQWLWGEVVSIDTTKNELVVKYLDYETEQEKQITIAADEKTTFENAQSLSGIQAADTVSVDYILSPEGKNIARSISVEKPEETSAPNEEIAPLEESIPEAPEPAPPASE